MPQSAVISSVISLVIHLHPFFIGTGFFFFHSSTSPFVSFPSLSFFSVIFWGGKISVVVYSPFGSLLWRVFPIMFTLGTSIWWIMTTAGSLGEERMCENQATSIESRICFARHPYLWLCSLLLSKKQISLRTCHKSFVAHSYAASSCILLLPHRFPRQSP